MRQQTVFITDTHANTDLQRLKDAGWEIISTRRASTPGLRTSPDEWGYELIVHGRARQPFRSSPSGREQYLENLIAMKSLLEAGSHYAATEKLPLFASPGDAAEWRKVRLGLRGEFGEWQFQKDASRNGTCTVGPEDTLRLLSFYQWDEWGQVLLVEVVSGPHAGRKMYCEPRLRAVAEPAE